MLSESERAAEVERRKSAGFAEIPKSFPDERIVSMETFDDALFLFSQRNIFRVRTSEEIDPNVTAKQVPWSVNAYLSIGTQHQLIASTFGMLRELSSFVIYKKEDQEFIRRLLMEFAVVASEMEFAKTLYENEINELINSEREKLKLVGTAVQLPRVKSFEISFSIFFSAAKRAIGKLLGILEWAAGFPIKNGTHIDKLINRICSKKKLSRIHELTGRLNPYIEPIQLINEIRNAFEHPGKFHGIVLQNITLQPDGNLLLPTWTLLHDEITLPQNQDFGVHLNRILETIAGLAEQTLLLVGALKEDGVFGWEATIKEPEKIDTDYPCRWVVNPIMPSRHDASHR